MYARFLAQMVGRFLYFEIFGKVAGDACFRKVTLKDVGFIY